MRKNIILIGFMGTGKSTVGQLLAQETGRAFYDIDALIEAEAGLSIPDIFAQKGEEYFRALEHTVIAQAISGEYKVLATGGGVVLNPANIRIMRENGWVICLQAGLDTLWERLSHTTGRPLLAVENPRERLAQLYQERATLYTAAHLTMEVDEKSPAQIVQEILDAMTHLP